MTSNQNAAKANEIAEEKAKEEQRSNKTREKETERSNRAGEANTQRGQNLKYMSDMTKAFTGLAGKFNDPSWYNKDPQLVKDVASFAFGAPLGSTKDNFIELFKQTASSEAQLTQEEAIAGVMNLKISTTIPNPQLMKTIGDKYYAFIRHANSGSRNYEANDLMMYLLAATECYGQVAHAAKIYSLLNTYKRENWYYSRGFLRSIGLTDNVIDQFIGNLSDFRSRINVLIRRINSFYIPNTFPLFARKVWLQLNIFKDHDTKRTSNYIFSPNHILLYTETSDNLRLDATPINYTSYSAYMMQLENMVDRIYRSEDLGIMSGDILKAYKDTGIYSVNEISEDFHIEETFSPEVLSQINSATVIGKPKLEYAGIYTRTTNSGSFIAQGKYDDLSSTNGYKLDYSINDVTPIKLATGEFANSDNVTIAYPQHLNGVINMYKDDVTPDDVMVASRFMAVVKVSKSSSPTDPNVTLVSCGDSVVNTCSVCRISHINGELNYTVGEFYDLEQDYIPTLQDTGVILYPNELRINTVPTFDWAPRLRTIYSYGMLFTATSSPSNPNKNSKGSDLLTYPIDTLRIETSKILVNFDNFDYANYMKISENNIANLHKVALMSMFDI